MGVSMHWRDLGQRKQPGVWAGLLLDVSACTPPAFTVSVCPPHCLRVAAGDRAMLWARVERDYWGVDLLRSDSPLSPGIVPPITAAQVREKHAADPARARAGWARFFAEALAGSGSSPLADGQWLLQPSLHGSAAVSIRPDMAALALARPALDALDWSDITLGCPVAPIPLRSPSPAQNGRVNAWARHARAGTLPPVLLMWVSGLQAHVVLDGHDRLQAAVQQGMDVPVLVLLRHEEGTLDEGALARADAIAASSAGAEMTVEARNRLLLDLYCPSREVLPSRGDLLRGGMVQWSAEVQARARAQGMDVRILLEP